LHRKELMWLTCSYLDTIFERLHWSTHSLSIASLKRFFESLVNEIFSIIINYNVHTSNSFSRCFENWLKFSKTIPKNMATLHYKSTKAFLHQSKWDEWKINQYLHWNSHKQILMDFPSMFVNHTQTKEYIEYSSKKIDPISQHSNVIISTYMHLA
jgi:translation elongation factor EF-Ts